VWDRQRKDEVLIDVEDVALGHMTKLRWNPAEKWIRSEQVAHAPIIDQDTFDLAQELLAGRGGTDEGTRLRVRRPYVLRGCLYCGICTRKMQGQWLREAAYYRCRFPNEYALANRVPHPRNVSLREADVLGPLDGWLSQVLAPDRIERTVDQMTASQDAYDHSGAAERARATKADCTTKLARYRAALDAGADPSVVTRWIADTQAEQVKAEAELRRLTGTVRMSRDEIRGIVESLTSLRTVLRDAAPQDKAEIYRHLDLRLTYQPAKQTVQAEASLDPDLRRVMDRVRGGT
jgi:site-specific DNA recombinase